MIIIRIKRKGIELFQGIILVTFLFVVLAFCGRIERYYSINAEVSKVENKVVTFEDKTGHLWQYIDYDNELTRGQKVKLSFYDNCTMNDRTDDKITKVKILLDNENG